MKVTILGCGSSTGVPAIGCDCAVCRSDNPKNKRLRVSVLVEIAGKNILIDTSPDLRQQALRHNLRRIDAVLYTHDHADHTGGLDDLRAFNFLANEAIPVYANKTTLNTLKNRYYYAFQQPKPDTWYRPCLMAHLLPDEPVHHFDVLGVPVTLFEQGHGRLKTFGYRIGNAAYSTDTNKLPDSAFTALAGLDIWIVDCLRYSPSNSHSHLAQTLGWIERARPKLGVLTHMDHSFDYDKLAGELPAGVVPAYDSMIVEV